jgi:nucleotide-binding universal stress UspA family protein
MPSKREWDQQRANVDKAIERLRSAGRRRRRARVGDARGAKRIVKEAQRLGCDAIVMGADSQRNWVIRDFMWSQEPYRVKRRADLPVYLVVDS